MGIFSAIAGLGIMKDILASGIASVKLTSAMEKLVDTAQKEYSSKFTPADKAFSLKYRKAAEKAQAAQDAGAEDEEQSKLTEAMEDKLAVFLRSLSKTRRSRWNSVPAARSMRMSMPPARMPASESSRSI